MPTNQQCVGTNCIPYQLETELLIHSVPNYESLVCPRYSSRSRGSSSVRTEALTPMVRPFKFFSQQFTVETREKQNTFWGTRHSFRRRKWHPTPVLLPGKPHEQRTLVGCQSMGSLRVGYDWATSVSLFIFMHWRRKWQPTPVFLPGESQGRGSLMGCHLWGRTESDTTSNLAAAAAAVQ